MIIFFIVFNVLFDNYFNFISNILSQFLPVIKTVFVNGLKAIPFKTSPSKSVFVFFDFNSAKLKPSMLAVIDRLIDLIKQNKNYSIEIKGYTDDIGKDDYNLNLSQKRADALKEYLLQNNISNSIVAIGFGKSNPKYNNSDASLKSKNRRVDVYFNK